MGNIRLSQGHRLLFSMIAGVTAASLSIALFFDDLGTAPYIFPYVFVCALFPGIPLAFYLIRKGKTRWWCFLLLGWINGTFPCTFLLHVILVGWPATFLISLFGGIFGTIGGFAAWVAWRALPPPYTKTDDKPVTS